MANALAAGLFSYMLSNTPVNGSFGHGEGEFFISIVNSGAIDLSLVGAITKDTEKLCLHGNILLRI